MATAAVAAERGAAGASSAAARGTTGGEGAADQSSTPSGTAGPGASSTAVYRRLLSLQGLWSAASAYSEKSVSSGSRDSRGKAVHGTSIAKGPSAGTAAEGCTCGCGSAFAELQYNVYNLQDYDPVWEHYAYLHPVWIGDFGKNNLSASSNMSDVARVSEWRGKRGSGS